MIFTGSRLHAALGVDHALFARLARWSPWLKTPVWALSMQTVLAVLLILAVGTETGQAMADSIVRQFGRKGIPWDRFSDGFEMLLAATAPLFWSFFLLSGLSIFHSRFSAPDADRPFRVPLYPIPPLIFCASCVFMIKSSVEFADDLILLALLPLLCGIPMYWLSQKLGTRASQ